MISADGGEQALQECPGKTAGAAAWGQGLACCELGTKRSKWRERKLDRLGWAPHAWLPRLASSSSLPPDSWKSGEVVPYFSGSGPRRTAGGSRKATKQTRHHTAEASGTSPGSPQSALFREQLQPGLCSSQRGEAPENRGARVRKTRGASCRGGALPDHSTVMGGPCLPPAPSGMSHFALRSVPPPQPLQHLTTDPPTQLFPSFGET